MKIAVRMVTAARAKSAKSDRSFQDAWACLKRFDLFSLCRQRIVLSLYDVTKYDVLACACYCIKVLSLRIGAGSVPQCLRCCELSYISNIAAAYTPPARRPDPAATACLRSRSRALDRISRVDRARLGSRLDLRARGAAGLALAPLASAGPRRTCASYRTFCTVPTKAARSGGV